MRNDVRGDLEQFNSRLLSIYSQTQRRIRGASPVSGVILNDFSREGSRAYYNRFRTTAQVLHARCLAAQPDAAYNQYARVHIRYAQDASQAQHDAIMRWGRFRRGFDEVQTEVQTEH